MTARNIKLIAIVRSHQQYAEFEEFMETVDVMADESTDFTKIATAAYGCSSFEQLINKLKRMRKL